MSLILTHVGAGGTATLKSKSAIVKVQGAAFLEKRPPSRASQEKVQA